METENHERAAFGGTVFMALRRGRPEAALLWANGLGAGPGLVMRLCRGPVLALGERVGSGSYSYTLIQLKTARPEQGRLKGARVEGPESQRRRRRRPRLTGRCGEACPSKNSMAALSADLSTTGGSPGLGRCQAAWPPPPLFVSAPARPGGDALSAPSNRSRRRPAPSPPAATSRTLPRAPRARRRAVRCARHASPRRADGRG
jgi:hypothetical protein